MSVSDIDRLYTDLDSEHAVHHVGFFYVKNFGIPQEDVDRQFTLAKNFFELPVSEKEKYEVNYGQVARFPVAGT